MSTHLSTFHDGEQQFDPTLPFTRENEAEVARQLLLHWQLSELIGGAVPASLDLSQVRRVLDVGYGVGGWVQEMAGRYPAIEVIGVDRSAYFVEQGQALVSDMRNATLLVKDIFALQDTFAAGSFDLIHMRFLGGEVTFQCFPALIQSLGMVQNHVTLLNNQAALEEYPKAASQ
jgi:SAM-dependent methyltransferase